MPNDALLRFSKEFNIPVDSPDITTKLLEEIEKIRVIDDKEPRGLR